MAHAPGDEPLLDEPTLARLRDLADKLRDTKGNILRELVDLFDTDGHARLDQLDAAVRSGNTADARRAAHTLKGAAGNVGARRVAALAGVLEKAPPTDPNASAPLRAALHDSVQALRTTLL